jgi:uncharacterized protein
LHRAADGKEATMRARLNVITLGVGDLQKSMAFYRDGLGLPTKGITGTQFEDGAVVFFYLREDFILALFPRTSLEKDSRVSLPAGMPSAFSLGQLVNSREEVDAVMKQAEKAGARVTDPAHKRVWGGYSGYFQDPDGHLWEIVWNPEMRVKD